MKKKYKVKRKRPFIIIKIKFKFVKIVSEVCIATLIIGNLQTAELKVDSSFNKYVNECSQLEELTREYLCL